MTSELRKEHLFIGAPDVNPTKCILCSNGHSRMSAFCSNRCRHTWNSRKLRATERRRKLAARGIKPATDEELL